jgi:hypothetical protein
MAKKNIYYKNKLFTKAIVDDEDEDILAKSWSVAFHTGSENTKYYRIRRTLLAQEKLIIGKSRISLHTEIWEKHYGPVPEGMTIDHKDFNTSNNTKGNLELMTSVANSNRRKGVRKLKCA